MQRSSSIQTKYFNKRKLTTIAVVVGTALFGALHINSQSVPGRLTLSAAFQRKVLTPPGEAVFNLRFFSTPVKTDSNGKIITGPNNDPVKNLVGAEAAGINSPMAFSTTLFRTSISMNLA